MKGHTVILNREVRIDFTESDILSQIEEGKELAVQESGGKSIADRKTTHTKPWSRAPVMFNRFKQRPKCSCSGESEGEQ